MRMNTAGELPQVEYGLVELLLDSHECFGDLRQRGFSGAGERGAHLLQVKLHRLIEPSLETAPLGIAGLDDAPTRRCELTPLSPQLSLQTRVRRSQPRRRGNRVCQSGITRQCRVVDQDG